MMRIFFSVSLLLALALHTGCRSTNTIERSERRASVSQVDTAHIDTDPSLANDLVLAELIEAELPDGTLKIQAEIFNESRSRIRFSYKVEWFDTAGMLIHQAGGGWRPGTIAGGESISISSVAPSTTAVDFRIKLIESNH